MSIEVCKRFALKKIGWVKFKVIPIIASVSLSGMKGKGAEFQVAWVCEHHPACGEWQNTHWRCPIISWCFSGPSIVGGATLHLLATASSFRPRFLHRGTIGILGAVLCIGECLAASLYPLHASTSPPPLFVMAKNVSRYCHTLVGQNHSQWRATTICQAELTNSTIIFVAPRTSTMTSSFYVFVYDGSSTRNDLTKWV